MLRLTLLGVLAHKLRYALTAFAVVLGVAFMAGTLVLTDTIGQTFDGLFSDIYRNTAAVVRMRESFSSPASFTSQRRRLNADIADRVRRIPGVAEVRVNIDGYAQLVGRNGRPIGKPQSGAPTLGEAWNGPGPMNPYRLTPGSRPPRTGSEIAIDKRSADVGHLRLGDRVKVLTARAPRTFRIVGLVRWGTADSPLGASITLFTRATAARMLGEPGKVDEVDVAAKPGISQQQMVDRIRARLADPRLQVLTGAQITAENQDQVRSALRFFDTFLLAFALIALFVGTFLIFNTFSIVVAQRLRELALLRAVGAGRIQVLGSVLGESAIIGIIASSIGLGAGVGLAIALRALLNAFGIDIPSTGLLVTTRTIVSSLLVGTVVTVVAAIGPARRAGRVAPVAALGQTASGEGSDILRRSVAGVLVVAGGLATLLLGLFADVSRRVLLVGIGAGVTFLGIAILGPLVGRALSGVLGMPLRVRGTVGQLARLNAMRSPRRTAATAAAMMTGVALVVVMSIVASSIKASVGSVVDHAMRADFIVSSGGQPGSAIGFSPSLQQRLSRLPEIASSTGVRVGTVRIHGSTTSVLAVEPRQVDDLFDVGVLRGSVASMGPRDVAISRQAADGRKLAIGDRLAVQFPATGTQSFRIRAIYRARELAGDYVLPIQAAKENFSRQLDFQVYLRLARGVSVADGRHAIERVIAAYPTAQLKDRTEYKAEQAAQIDQLLNLVYGLLGLALFIALVGIANTLALSVHERIREIGLLRAVGMTRAQVRSTVRYEAVIIAMFGVAEGLLIGTAFGVAVSRALESEGLHTISVPVLRLLIISVLAGLAGMVAAIRPSARAARLDVLRALHTE